MTAIPSLIVNFSSFFRPVSLSQQRLSGSVLFSNSSTRKSDAIVSKKFNFGFNQEYRQSQQRRKISVKASSAANGSSEFSEPNKNSENDADKASPFPLLKVASIAAALIFVGALCFATVTNGPMGLIDAVSKSGFTAAFSLIFVSEIGDKTFFIAALLAMKHSRTMVLAGATSALAVMTIISVIIGKIFNAMPAQLTSNLPIGEYLAIALLIWFGFRSIKDALSLPSSSSSPPGTNSGQIEEVGSELAEAQEFVDKIKENKFDTPWKVFVEAFTLIFVAEWGDRSMIATIALAAAQSPVGVASGAILGHFIATLIAVLGGSFMAKHISERVVGLIGGILFLLFAVATGLGVF